MTVHGDGQPDDQDEGWGRAVSAESGSPHPGDIIVQYGQPIAAEPLVGSDESSPLGEDEPEHTIPPAPLWAMKDHRHVQWHLLASHERHDRIRECLELDDWTLYCIDDGRHDAMIARRVGMSPSGCEYVLIGRVTRRTYEDLRDEVVMLANAFDTATEIRLCGVDVEEDVKSSVVSDVALYQSIDEVPAEYRPGSPFQHFHRELEITAY
jgi:hypothetical protein